MSLLLESKIEIRNYGFSERLLRYTFFLYLDSSFPHARRENLVRDRQFQLRVSARLSK